MDYLSPITLCTGEPSMQKGRDWLGIAPATCLLRRDTSRKLAVHYSATSTGVPITTI
jgi:hypothetical protein